MADSATAATGASPVEAGATGAKKMDGRGSMWCMPIEHTLEAASDINTHIEGIVAAYAVAYLPYATVIAATTTFGPEYSSDPTGDGPAAGENYFPPPDQKVYVAWSTFQEAALLPSIASSPTPYLLGIYRTKHRLGWEISFPALPASYYQTQDWVNVLGSRVNKPQLGVVLT
jgi:hypothetical protein